MRELVAAFELRAAQASDADAIDRISTGPIADKRAFIVESLERRSVIVAGVGERVIGYLVWDRAFFGRPFAWLVGVDPIWRRRGVAGRMLRAFAADCPNEAVFTSTNQSNAAMQAALGALGFEPTGRVENLDPGDPELFYFKPCRSASSWPK